MLAELLFFFAHQPHYEKLRGAFPKKGHYLHKSKINLERTAGRKINLERTAGRKICEMILFLGMRPK
ncbi:MAG: hypothetical protein DRR16_15930 [Candidatus Parabeggiatoa sp. nov. 3]|nr:MAG: hypothetical protein DRR00_21140 [Gammaproteobacteria bacterium]RKZ62978.1 MAG: hypothetical protein DRQ99_17850 [Gammaproteobacteria bacterium]RKZ83978.1 MAG: hypothetical protein DRR16_15930 [Gammaproteobacteria bacterium]